VRTRPEAPAGEIDLLLQTASYIACTKYGGTHLIIDRSGDLTDVLIAVDDATPLDLWDLDPILWDDAHWAGSRSVPAGTRRSVSPVLHKN
jgi:hypothetical protein